MAQQRVISADSHVIEPDDIFERALANKYGEAIPRVVDERAGVPGRYIFTGDDYLRDVDPDALIEEASNDELNYAAMEPADRVRLMDEDGVQAEVLGPTFGLFIYPSSNTAMIRDCFSVYNDWLAEFCSHAPQRLLGIALVHMEDVDWAIRELERAARRDMRCVMINGETRPEWPPYYDRRYDPFWARAQEIGMPVQLHILTGNRKDPSVLPDDRLGEVARLQLDTSHDIGLVLANDFIFGGILDRFPELKLVVGEYEVSWVPYWLFRLEQLEKSFGPHFRLAPPKRAARDYLDHVYFGVIDDPYVAHVAGIVAPERLLWGSDFPHIRNTFGRSHDVIERIFSHLDAGAVEAATIRNAEALFRVEIPASTR